MRFDSRDVVEMLQELERQGKAFRPLSAEVAGALNRGEFQLALEANGRLQDVLESIVDTRGRLREQIIHADGMGEPERSLGELAIRAGGVVIFMEISRIRDLLREPHMRAQTSSWFVGQFEQHGADAVATYFHNEMHQINNIWKPYRQDQPPLAGVSAADRLTMYLTTVRIAQRAMRELKHEPDLARFLACGVAAADLPDVQTSCKQIDTVLSLEIDVEPGRQIMPRRRLLDATSSATENQ